MIGVFGGRGFIGRHLCERLSASGHAVRIFDRPEVIGEAAAIATSEAIGVDFAAPSTYRDHLQDLDAVVLLVSASVPGTFADDMAAEVQHNVLPYARFLKELDGTGIRHVVYLSSGGTVYGLPQSELIAEDHVLAPISPYGCGKSIIETLVRSMSATHDWTHTILRPSNPIGEGQSGARGQGLVATILHRAATELPVEVWGNGDTVRDYFDVRDLARAIELALTAKEARGLTFNVSRGEGTSILDIIDVVEGALGHSVEKQFRESRSVDVPRNVLDNSAIRHHLGWTCRHTLTDSVKTMVEKQT